MASKAQLQLQRVKEITQDMLEGGESAAVDKGTQSRAPGADGPQAGNKLEKERKIIISHRQQAMHDLDRNHGSSLLLQHQRTSRNLDYQWPEADNRVNDIKRGTGSGGGRERFLTAAV